MSQRSKSSSRARPRKGEREIAEKRDHLKVGTVAIRCRTCGKAITIDINGAEIEYGHRKLANNGGPCPDRPAKLD